MEDFLQNLKTLRSQMNDVEDQAAKITVEEQTQITTIQTLQKDLDSAKFETRRIKEDTDVMVKEKGEICSQILEKQKKVSALESDSVTLNQTLTLIQQENASLSSQLVERSTYYTKVAEDILCKLQEQKEWINAYRLSSKVKVNINEKTRKLEALTGNCNVGSHLVTDNMDEVEKNLIKSLDSAKAKFDSFAQMKFKLVSDNCKVKQSIELLKNKMEDYKPELKEMDSKSLKEEIEALLSDKAGEAEYLQSLQHQIEMLKGISHMVRCACGMEYKVELVCT